MLGIETFDVSLDVSRTKRKPFCRGVCRVAPNIDASGSDADHCADKRLNIDLAAIDDYLSMAAKQGRFDNGGKLRCNVLIMAATVIRRRPPTKRTMAGCFIVGGGTIRACFS